MHFLRTAERRHGALNNNDSIIESVIVLKLHACEFLPHFSFIVSAGNQLLCSNVSTIWSPIKTMLTLQMLWSAAHKPSLSRQIWKSNLIAKKACHQQLNPTVQSCLIYSVVAHQRYSHSLIPHLQLRFILDVLIPSHLLLINNVRAWMLNVRDETKFRGICNLQTRIWNS